MSDPTPLLHPLKDARRLGGNIGHTLAYELIARGDWEAVKIGKKTVITDQSLRAWMASLPRAKVGPAKQKADA